MQLSIEHKFAFLCIPKCGSTSVELAIRKHCRVKLGGHPSVKHINARAFEHHIRPLLHVADPQRQIETFCIMRDPIDRLRSWYEYQKREVLKDPAHVNHARYNGHITFTEFVEAYLSDERPPYARIGTQSEFVRLADGSMGVDRIFRLDQMDAVAGFLSRKCGRNIVIPVANRSVRPQRTGFFRKAVIPSPAERPTRLELPDNLISRLGIKLEADYEIYNQLPQQ